VGALLLMGASQRLMFRRFLVLIWYTGLVCLACFLVEILFFVTDWRVGGSSSRLVSVACDFALWGRFRLVLLFGVVSLGMIDFGSVFSVWFSSAEVCVGLFNSYGSIVAFGCGWSSAS